MIFPSCLESVQFLVASMIDWSTNETEKRSLSLVEDGRSGLALDRPQVFAHAFERAKELRAVTRREARDDFAVGRGHRSVELTQQGEARRRGVAQHLASILGTALPAHPALLFHAVEQPGHARCPFDHPFGDGEGGKSFCSGAAKNAQHVELLRSDSLRLEHPRRIPAHGVGGEHQGDRRLVSQRLKRLGLVDLALEALGGSRRHGKYCTRHWLTCQLTAWR